MIIDIISTILGEKLEGIKLQHPFYDRTVPVVLGDHVTIDAGTGACIQRLRMVKMIML